MRKRADTLLVERGYFESRARAQAAIAAGLVRVDGTTLAKASQAIATDAAIEAELAHPYASRGGIKLAHALDHFEIDPGGRIALDTGASTGGFTDVLLKRGASLVHAIDTGRDQLHASLRGDPRIISREGCDIRNLGLADFAEQPSLGVIDVSFISLELVLPAVTGILAMDSELVALIKPQFECGRQDRKKGIVRDEAVRLGACAKIRALAEMLGWQVRGIIASPVKGGDGNHEFLMAASRSGA